MASTKKKGKKRGKRQPDNRKTDKKYGSPPRNFRVVGFDDKAEKLVDFGVADALYFRELHKIIDMVYKEAYDECGWEWKDLADAAGLSRQTVYKLGYRWTKWPQFRTVWRLCKAVGWDLIPKPQPKKERVDLQLAKAA